MKHNSDGAQPTARKAKAKKVNVQELDIAVRERLDDKKLNDEVFHLNKNDGLGSGDDLHGRRKFLIGAAGGLASLGALRGRLECLRSGPGFCPVNREATGRHPDGRRWSSRYDMVLGHQHSRPVLQIWGDGDESRRLSVRFEDAVGRAANRRLRREGAELHDPFSRPVDARDTEFLPRS